MPKEPSSVHVTSVPDSQAEAVEPGGSTPTQLQPLTEEQAPFFSRLPSIQMPTGRRVFSVQCSLSALTEGFVCKFNDCKRAVSGMQSMLEVFKQPDRYVCAVFKVKRLLLVPLSTWRPPGLHTLCMLQLHLDLGALAFAYMAGFAFELYIDFDILLKKE